MVLVHGPHQGHWYTPEGHGPGTLVHQGVRPGTRYGHWYTRDFDQGHWYTRDLDHTKKCMKSEESMDGYWEPGGDTFTFEGTTHACREVSQGFARSESQNVNIKCQDMQICHGGFSLLEIVEVETLDSISWWPCKFQFPRSRSSLLWKV